MVVFASTASSRFPNSSSFSRISSISLGFFGNRFRGLTFNSIPFNSAQYKAVRGEFI